MRFDLDTRPQSWHYVYANWKYMYGINIYSMYSKCRPKGHAFLRASNSVSFSVKPATFCGQFRFRRKRIKVLVVFFKGKRELNLVKAYRET